MLKRSVLLLGGSGLARAGSSRLLSSGGTGGSAADQLGSIPLAFPAVCIWGSNTGVGKTLFSAGLAAACRRAGLSVLYLKPAQTGFPQDSDARLVGTAADLALEAGPHAAYLDPQGIAGGGSNSRSSSSSDSGSSSQLGQLAKTLHAWQQAVSPHLAVETEGRPVSDQQFTAAVAAELRSFAAAGVGSGSRGSGDSPGQIAIVETAGGVASPGPSGSLQCDLLRTLRLPGILVGDGRLGGISATLSAYDSLTLRGHQVPVVVLMDTALANAAAIQRHLRGKASVIAFPMCQPPPALPETASEVAQGQQAGIDVNLAAWLAASEPQFDAMLRLAQRAHEERVAKLAAAGGEARRTLWWPFTQHGSVGEDSAVTVIDGRVGESFSVFRPAAAAAAGGAGGTGGDSGSTGGTDRLELLYDACASWWTQGVSQEAQPEMVRAVSAAAARYGHVMFPQNAHEPALELARAVLGSAGAGWASRVFYSDNGSTAIEVALKMAFRKYMVDHGLLEADGAELQVVGLQEGYHGDTLGAMEAVAPSPFNGRLQTPWYSGRGLFLDPPTVSLQQGEWRVQLPADLQAAAAAADAEDSQLQTRFVGQGDVFALQQRMEVPAAGGGSSTSGSSGPLYRLYRQHLQQQVEQYQQQAQQQQRRHLAACILEPVLQGAGGMRLIDPLYQRALVEVCRAARIPVIYDEVFTGFWRLGAQGGGSLLGTPPDIACYAKLLTGGMLPLAVTAASEDVFKAFEGASKTWALLHGHSYTAHPVGCSAGVAALKVYEDPALNPNWCTPEVAGRCQKDGGCSRPCGRMLPQWDESAVTALSQHPSVHSVVPLGTVLAVQLRSEEAGYASNAAAVVVERLRQDGVYGRPLGNVVYLMVTPMTQRQQCSALLDKLVAALG